MADARLLPVGDRKQVLSPLLQAQARATTGVKVNFCPFNCEESDLDEHGYCEHLIGFTNDGQTYEPMIMDPTHGRRVVQVQKDAQGRPILEKIQRGDKQVRISISSRVYRATGQPKAEDK